MEKTKRQIYDAARYAKNREARQAHSRAYRASNAEKIRAHDRAIYQSQAEKQRARHRAYHARNRDKRLGVKRAYRANNPDKIRSYWEGHREERAAYERNRTRTNPRARLEDNCRNRVYTAIVRASGSQKSARTRDLLGCTIPELRAHLEKQFRPGMTWENYGPVWHVDHILPCARFDLTDPVQQRECFNFTNLQPLFADENRKKGAR